MGTTRRGKQSDSSSSWPLGEYLREARGRMSVREAARRAEVSESRWRQVEAGVQKMAGGIEVPVHPRPETVAAMCVAIGADAARGLELAGHDPDQYRWLVEAPTSAREPESLEWFAALSRTEREEVLAQLQKLHLDTELGQSQQPRRKGRGVAG